MNDKSYLVVGEEAAFLGILSGLAAAAGRTVDLVHLRVGQSECSAVCRHPNDELILGGSQTDPGVRRVLDAELFPPFAVGRRSVQGSIVASFSLPLAVEIVCHEVDEVQITASVISFDYNNLVLKKLSEDVFIVSLQQPPPRPQSDSRINNIRYMIFKTPSNGPLETLTVLVTNLSSQSSN